MKKIVNRLINNKHNLKSQPYGSPIFIVTYRGFKLGANLNFRRKIKDQVN